jgi:hypothetical protein
MALGHTGISIGFFVAAAYWAILFGTGTGAGLFYTCFFAFASRAFTAHGYQQ